MKMSVNSYLDSLSSALVLKSNEKESIKRSILTLRQRLNSYFDNIEEMIEFGSYTRGTILPRKADSKSDIDFMIVFNNSSDYKPQTYLNQLKRFAEKKYSTSEIFQSSPTIVLNLNHIKFELVPSYTSGLFWKTYHIPAPQNTFYEWIETSPNEFNDELIRRNGQENNKIKPIVRLAKYWNAQNGYVYSSFLLEKYIIECSYSYLCRNVADYFFEFAMSLSTSHLSQTSANKVHNLQRVINEIKTLRRQGNEGAAEIKMMKLMPKV